MTYQMPVSMDLTFQGEVAIIQMKGEENRINTLFCKSWLKALEVVEMLPHIKALVTTGSGRFYSNGLDLNFLSIATSQELEEYRECFMAFQKKLLYFPMVTIAAINGHCFAGGMIVAYLHDYRVMQKGKGWMCLNEVDLGMRFPSSMMKLFQCKGNRELIRSAAIFGKRFTAEEALTFKIADRISNEGDSVQAAVEMARDLVKNRSLDRGTVEGLKMDFYSDALGDDFTVPNVKSAL